MDKVGNDGVITIEESNGLDTELEVVEGMQFDRGYQSPYMVTDSDKMIAELERPYILVTDKKSLHSKISYQSFNKYRIKPYAWNIYCSCSKST